MLRPLRLQVWPRLKPALQLRVLRRLLNLSQPHLHQLLRPLNILLPHQTKTVMQLPLFGLLPLTAQLRMLELLRDGLQIKILV